MTTQEHAPGGDFTKCLDRPAQSGAIRRAIARRRTVRPNLAKRQIAPQHSCTRARECFCHTDQQRRVTIRPGAVRQYKGSP